MTLRNSKKFWKRSCKRNKSYNSGFVRTFCFVTVFAGRFAPSRKYRANFAFGKTAKRSTKQRYVDSLYARLFRGEFYMTLSKKKLYFIISPLFILTIFLSSCSSTGFLMAKPEVLKYGQIFPD